MIRLLDTSAILAHHRQELGWERVQAIFEDPKQGVLLSAVSVTELGHRLRALGASPKDVHTTLDSYLALLNVVAIDEEIARSAVEIGASVAGRLPLADALIAACAQYRGACLVHRDTHMSAIPPEVIPQIDLAVSEVPV